MSRIADSHGLLQAWLGITRGGLLVIDGQGLLHWVNRAAARWLGIDDLAPATGTAWEGLWPEDDHPQLRTALASAWQGHAFTFRSLQAGTGATDTASTDVSASPVRDALGAVVAVLLLVHATERGSSRAESFPPANPVLVARHIARAERLHLLGRLVSGVAHDLSNMLNVVTNSSAFVRMRGGLDEAQTQSLQAIDRAMRLGTTLLRRLLDGAGVDTATAVPLQLDELLTEYAGLFEPLLGERVRLRIQRAQPAWPVVADPQAIISVLMNLLANARDALGEAGGEVDLQVRNVPAHDCPGDLRAGDHVCLSVHDGGCGIAPDVLARLGREAFVTTKPPGQGTGLGLTSAFELARSAGGDVRIDSRPGGGTTVALYLPRAGAVAP